MNAIQALTVESYREQVKHPGKFGGEPAYAVHYYNLMLDGNADATIDENNQCPIDVFTVTPGDRELFPELGEVDVIVIWESENGFIYTRQLSSAQLDTLKAECHVFDESDLALGEEE